MRSGGLIHLPLPSLAYIPYAYTRDITRMVMIEGEIERN